MSPSDASRRRFAEVVRSSPVDLGLACLLIGAEVDPDLDPNVSLAELDALAAQVDPDEAARAPAAALRAVLGGFTGDSGSYAHLESSLLHEVLRRRTGLPILLSVVWLEVARRCGVPAAGIGLPGHFVVRVGGGDAAEYVDPFAGGAPLPAGTLTGASAEQLRPWGPEETLLRVLTNIRAWAGREPGRFAGRDPARSRVRLWAIELSLLLPHRPVALRRERAAVLVSLGDFLGGAREFEDYADQVEPVDAAAAEQARQHARLVRSRMN